MNCPYCGHYDSKVIDSRDVNEGIRRRRQCLRCESRFTTYERLQPASLFGIKKDGRREEYDRDKILTGIRKACEKGPLEGRAVDRLVDDVEAELFQMGRTEIPSRVIGDRVMARLKVLDLLMEGGDFSDVVREAQEAVELAAKAILRRSGVDPPKWHDVGGIIMEQSERFAPEHAADLERLAAISKRLRKERELSFYGDVDFIPTEEYALADAARARDEARFVVDLAGRILA